MTDGAVATPWVRASAAEGVFDIPSDIDAQDWEVVGLLFTRSGRELPAILWERRPRRD